ncbi:MAG: spore coat protein [Bacilli bacterium]
MNNKELLLDVLEMEKNMAVNMTYSLNESSNEALYKELFTIFDVISKSTKKLFTLAYNKDYYVLEKEDSKKIKEAVKTLRSEFDCCPK